MGSGFVNGRFARCGRCRGPPLGIFSPGGRDGVGGAVTARRTVSKRPRMVTRIRMGKILNGLETGKTRSEREEAAPSLTRGLQ